MSTTGVLNVESRLEKIVSICLVIMLSGVFAYSLNSIGNILDFFSKDEIELKLQNIIKKHKIN